MSATLRKRNHRLEDLATNSIFRDALLPAGVLILFLFLLVAMLGHFFPAG